MLKNLRMSSHIFQKDVMGVILEYAVAHPGFSVVVPSLHWATTYDFVKISKRSRKLWSVEGGGGHHRQWFIVFAKYRNPKIYVILVTNEEVGISQLLCGISVLFTEIINSELYYHRSIEFLIEK